MPNQARKGSGTRGRQRRWREPDIDRLGREAFINLFLAAGRFTDEVEKLCRDEEMAMSHYVVLWFLCRRHEAEEVPMGAVADGHLNRASDATRLADRLIKLGYLERFNSAEDRRVVLVRVTPAGRDVFVRLTRRVKELHRAQWHHLSPGELGELNRLLAKALSGAEASASTRHPLIGGSTERH
jgi:DNA-binding MarR family transcriptional regulator